MQFKAPLVRATLIKRYKRFLADVTLDDGSVVTAHCPNPGSMMGLKDEGSTVWLTHWDDPKRKLKHTWELIETRGALVGINTQHPNKLVEEAILAGQVPELAGYATLRREVKYGKNSRIDILLEDPHKGTCYVEVKNVHLRRDDGPDGAGASGLAEFPDSVTARGAKHLVEMADMVADGHRAVMVYLVQRMDCDRLAMAADIDPKYAAALTTARGKGVEALAIGCRIGTDEIVVDRSVTLVVD